MNGTDERPPAEYEQVVHRLASAVPDLPTGIGRVRARAHSYRRRRAAARLSAVAAAVVVVLILVPGMHRLTAARPQPQPGAAATGALMTFIGQGAPGALPGVPRLGADGSLGWIPLSGGISWGDRYVRTPSGRTVVLGPHPTDGHLLRVFRPDGSELLRWRLTGNLDAAPYAATDTRVFFRTNGVVMAIDLRTGVQRLVPIGLDESGWIHAADLHPDGRQLVTLRAGTEPACRLTVAGIADNRHSAVYQLPGPCGSPVSRYSPGGRFIAVARWQHEGAVVTVVDVATGRVVHHSSLATPPTDPRYQVPPGGLHGLVWPSARTVVYGYGQLPPGRPDLIGTTVRTWTVSF